MARDSSIPPGWSTSQASPAREEGVDLTHLFNALRTHWLFIALCGVLLFAAVVGATMFSSMKFRSSARLYLGEVGRAQKSDGIDLSGADLSGVATEVEILRTRYLIERAVIASGQNVIIASPGWKPPRYWKWRWSGRDLGLLDGAQGRLQATDTALTAQASEPQSYTIKFVSDIDYTASVGNRTVGSSKLGMPLKTDGLRLTLLPGDLAMPEAGETYVVTVLPTADVVEYALANLEIKAPEESGGNVVKVLTLGFTDRSPHGSARFLAALMQAYLEERQAWKTEDASAAEAFVSKQLQKMRSSLDGTQEKLANYRSENRGVISEGEAAAMVEQLGRYEEQRVAARLEVSALRDVRRALDNPNAPLEAFMFGEAQDAVLQGMATSLSEERQRLTDLMSKFKEAAPDVKQQQAKVNAQMRMIKNYVGSRLSRAQDNLGQLNRVISEYEDRLRTIPTAELGLAQIGRESEVYSKMFSYLLERQQQTAIVKASTVSKNRVLDMPVVPRMEHSPTLSLRLASGLVGLLLGAFLVIARALMSSALRNDAEVRTRFPRLPVLASVPLRSVPRRRRGPTHPPLFDVLAGGIEGFTFTEAFRTLRTNLLNRSQDDHGKALLFTSPGPGDGKTTCVLSLAAILAADDRRVLVIDGDLRKPSHHVLTGVRSGVGLNAYIRGESPWRSAVQPVALSRGSFDLLPTRRSGSAELLSSPRFARLLIEARSNYDFVLVDVASYPLVSDALALAKQVDLVVSVFRLGHTTRRAADEHARDLSTVAGQLALVVNNSELLGGASYYYGNQPDDLFDAGEKSMIGAASQRLQ